MSSFRLSTEYVKGEDGPTAKRQTELRFSNAFERMFVHVGVLGPHSTARAYRARSSNPTLCDDTMLLNYTWHQGLEDGQEILGRVGGVGEWREVMIRQEKALMLSQAVDINRRIDGTIPLEFDMPRDAHLFLTSVFAAGYDTFIGMSSRDVQLAATPVDRRGGGTANHFLTKDDTWDESEDPHLFMLLWMRVPIPHGEHPYVLYPFLVKGTKPEFFPAANNNPFGTTLRFPRLDLTPMELESKLRAFLCFVKDPPIRSEEMFRRSVSPTINSYLDVWESHQDLLINLKEAPIVVRVPLEGADADGEFLQPDPAPSEYPILKIIAMHIQGDTGLHHDCVRKLLDFIENEVASVSGAASSTGFEKYASIYRGCCNGDEVDAPLSFSEDSTGEQKGLWSWSMSIGTAMSFGVDRLLHRSLVRGRSFGGVMLGCPGAIPSWTSREHSNTEYSYSRGVPPLPPPIASRTKRLAALLQLHNPVDDVEKYERYLSNENEVLCVALNVDGVWV